ncbi:unnamed protein product [Alternaria alternata]
MGLLWSSQASEDARGVSSADTSCPRQMAKSVLLIPQTGHQAILVYTKCVFVGASDLADKHMKYANDGGIIGVQAAAKQS